MDTKNWSKLQVIIIFKWSPIFFKNKLSPSVGAEHWFIKVICQTSLETKFKIFFGLSETFSGHFSLLFLCCGSNSTTFQVLKVKLTPKGFQLRYLVLVVEYVFRKSMGQMWLWTEFSLELSSWRHFYRWPAKNNNKINK